MLSCISSRPMLVLRNIRRLDTWSRSRYIGRYNEAPRLRTAENAKFTSCSPNSASKAIASVCCSGPVTSGQNKVELSLQLSLTTDRPNETVTSPKKLKSSEIRPKTTTGRSHLKEMPPKKLKAMTKSNSRPLDPDRDPGRPPPPRRSTAPKPKLETVS